VEARTVAHDDVDLSKSRTSRPKLPAANKTQANSAALVFPPV